MPAQIKFDPTAIRISAEEILADLSYPAGTPAARPVRTRRRRRRGRRRR